MRRRFFDLHHTTGPAIAAETLKRIAGLRAVEERIRGLPPDARRRVLGIESEPWLAGWKTWLDDQLRRLPGKGDLAKAVRYTLSRWRALTPYLEDGIVAVDSDAAERAMRNVVLGRKSSLFAGSDRGGERAAAICALTETAKLNGRDPEAWLRDALIRTADHPVDRVDELLPRNRSAGRRLAPA